MERENHQVVQAAAEAVNGGPLRVKIVSLDQPQDDREQTEDASFENSGSASERDALQQRKRHVIQSVVDLFEGTIIT
jgi:hypothetical protein